MLVVKILVVNNVWISGHGSVVPFSKDFAGFFNMKVGHVDSEARLALHHFPM